MSKSKRRFACWQCGGRMRKKDLVCKKCRRTRPQAAKATVATVTKARGAPVRPVPVPAVSKAPKPRCAAPACRRAKGRRGSMCCTRCGRPFSPAAATAAQKAATSMQARLPGRPERFEALARSEHDPEKREAWLAEARKARQERGSENADLAALLVRESNSRTLGEAFQKTADPHAQAILLGVMNERR